MVDTSQTNKSRENSAVMPLPDSRSAMRPPSPTGVIVCMILTITLVIAVTELLEAYYHPSEATEGLLHILVLTGVMAPLFYFFWFRPLTRQIAISHACEEEVRTLSHRLMGVGEAERRKLARDLHDEFGQKLTSLQILVDGLQQTLAEGQLPPPDICRSLMGLIADLSSDLSNVLADLRPDALDDLGLAPALESLCSEITQQQPTLLVDLHCSGVQQRLHPDLETALFRACQEALTNVIRHARAHQVEVCLTRSHPRVILTIQDDGIGFKADARETADSRFTGRFGLIGMRERVASVGGSIRIIANPGGGTRIRIEVPEALQTAGESA
jgi:signal transduction histidine kinase